MTTPPEANANPPALSELGAMGDEVAIVYQSPEATIIMDRADVPLLRDWKVYPSIMKNKRVKYAFLSKWDRGSKRVLNGKLHRLIMGAKPGELVCHLNGNGLDCRRSNLAIGTPHDNANSHRNKTRWAASKYRGVYINNGGGKRWTASIKTLGKQYYLGRYDTQEEAAKAYDREALRRFGIFAHLNFPIQQSQ